MISKLGGWILVGESTLVDVHPVSRYLLLTLHTTGPWAHRDEGPTLLRVVLPAL